MLKFQMLAVKAQPPQRTAPAAVDLIPGNRIAALGEVDACLTPAKRASDYSIRTSKP
jgi:hypothetical protein